MSERMPYLWFASPRKLPKADLLEGRVVVLDVAFAGEGLGVSFEKVTGRFIRELGERLAAWVDHHDNKMHAEYRDDPRFVLASKSEHAACPEMITPELVRRVGQVDTVVCHRDLDGLYAAAKWILDGQPPYPEADADARAVDTRIGKAGPHAELVDRALRARPADDAVGRVTVSYLTGGLDPRGPELEILREAADEFAVLESRARRMAEGYVVEGAVAVVEVSEGAEPYDKTELLLLGQKLAAVAVVKQGPHFTAAAPFDSGLDLVEMMGVGGGMPTRISMRASRLEELVFKVNSSVR